MLARLPRFGPDRARLSAPPRPRRRLLIAACFLSGLVACHLAAYVPRAAAAEPADDGGGQTVDVMTYNIRYLNRGDGPDHWKHRADTVAEVMSRGDIVGLQEATRAQIDDLVPQLPDFEWYGAGRDDGKDRGEFSPVFWRKDRFEAIDRGTFWLGPDPEAVGKPAWGARLPRVCSWVVLRFKGPSTPGDGDGGADKPRELLVMNTHFDHQSGEARVNSARLLRKQAERLAEGRDLVVMGDLNARPDSEPLVILTAEEGDFVLADTITRSESPAEGPTGTWNGFRQINPNTRIDFILTRADRPRVLAHRTADPKTPAGRFASDHLPVTVSLQR